MHAGPRILIALALLWVVACESQYQENWDRLKPGLTREQVEHLLGPPSSRYEPRSEDGKVVIEQARWQYGDNLSSLATGAMFPGEPHPHAWVVWFDEKGMVTTFQRADWAGGRGGP
ncbi:MAG: outer membrane protein assembly factor BamE [Planctomycetes bacterium]|nr:outer membrane protein assembly factor BamE [Planctomycetota bacterium]